MWLSMLIIGIGCGIISELLGLNAFIVIPIGILFIFLITFMETNIKEDIKDEIIDEISNK